MVAPVSAQGTVCVYVYGKADVLIDINGISQAKWQLSTFFKFFLSFCNKFGGPDDCSDVRQQVGGE